MARRALRFMGWKFLACVLLGWVQLGHAHAQDATTGLQIISDRAKGNCVACHSLPGQIDSSGGITSTLRPASGVLRIATTRYSCASGSTTPGRSNLIP